MHNGDFMKDVIYAGTILSFFAQIVGYRFALSIAT